jgi:hypothetical protein
MVGKDEKAARDAEDMKKDMLAAKAIKEQKDKEKLEKKKEEIKAKVGSGKKKTEKGSTDDQD